MYVIEPGDESPLPDSGRKGRSRSHFRRLAHLHSGRASPRFPPDAFARAKIVGDYAVPCHQPPGNFEPGSNASMQVLLQTWELLNRDPSSPSGINGEQTASRQGADPGAHREGPANADGGRRRSHEYASQRP